MSRVAVCGFKTRLFLGGYPSDDHMVTLPQGADTFRAAIETGFWWQVMGQMLLDWRRRNFPQPDGVRERKMGEGKRQRTEREESERAASEFREWHRVRKTPFSPRSNVALWPMESSRSLPLFLLQTINHCSFQLLHHAWNCLAIPPSSLSACFPTQKRCAFSSLVLLRINLRVQYPTHHILLRRLSVWVCQSFEHTVNWNIRLWVVFLVVKPRLFTASGQYWLVNVSGCSLCSLLQRNQVIWTSNTPEGLDWVDDAVPEFRRSLNSMTSTNNTSYTVQVCYCRLDEYRRDAVVGLWSPMLEGRSTRWMDVVDSLHSTINQAQLYRVDDGIEMALYTDDCST